MVRTTSFFLAGMLALTAHALPTPDDGCGGPAAPQTSGVPAITAQQLITIDPKTANCNTPATKAGPDECADANRAAPAITASFQKYGITEPGVQAALIAIMLFESGSFKYNKNHFGGDGNGNPGQGTRNMQNLVFNKQYLQEVLPDQAAAVAAQGGDAVVAALNKDDAISFGSAAWFLTKAQPDACTPAIRKGLAAGTQQGWEAYLTGCVGTTAAPERNASWKAAKSALGVK